MRLNLRPTSIRSAHKFLPITGQQIKPPSFLAEYQPDYVILMNPIYVRGSSA